MSNISDYFLHENRIDNARQLAASLPVGMDLAMANRPTQEQIDKMVAEKVEQGKEWNHRRKAALIVELAEKVLLTNPEAFTVGNAFEYAQQFLDRAAMLFDGKWPVEAVSPAVANPYKYGDVA